MSTTAEAPRLSLNKFGVFERLGYMPHDGQRVIHASPARHRVSACGRRFGKSVVGGHELTVEGLYTYTQQDRLRDQGIRREFWIVGPEYTDSEKEFRVLYNDLSKMGVPFDKPGTYNNPESGTMHISMWGGAFQVGAKSAKYPSTLVGEGLSGVVMAEAAKMKESVWVKFIRPTLADFQGWSLWNSTPEGRNYFYDLWRRGQDPADAPWSSWRMPSWVNPVVFPLGREDPELVDMAADMSPVLFEQEIAASFVEYVGRVFKGFDEEIHVRDVPYDPGLPLYGAVDYGWTNPFVWLAVQVDVFDNVRVVGEYRVERTDINDIARDLKQWPLAAGAQKMYVDPASPGDTAVLEKALRIQASNQTGGELKHRLEMIRQALKLTPEHILSNPAHAHTAQPKLVIDRNCVGLIREMQDYRYPENKSEVRPNPEEPLDKDNHGPEALGRFYRGHYGAVAGEQQRARVSRATLNGRRRR